MSRAATACDFESGEAVEIRWSINESRFPADHASQSFGLDLTTRAAVTAVTDDAHEEISEAVFESLGPCAGVLREKRLALAETVSYFFLRRYPRMIATVPLRSARAPIA